MKGARAEMEKAAAEMKSARAETKKAHAEIKKARAETGKALPETISRSRKTVFRCRKTEKGTPEMGKGTPLLATGSPPAAFNCGIRGRGGRRARSRGAGGCPRGRIGNAGNPAGVGSVALPAGKERTRLGAMNRCPPGRVLDCGGKRSATPLSHARRRGITGKPSARPKAPSPLRSADAVQNLAVNHRLMEREHLRSPFFPR